MSVTYEDKVNALLSTTVSVTYSAHAADIAQNV